MTMERESCETLLPGHMQLGCQVVVVAQVVMVFMVLLLVLLVLDASACPQTATRCALVLQSALQHLVQMRLCYT